MECFNTYDVRGRLGETLDADVARRIGNAFARVLGTENVVIGHDARPSSPMLKSALIDGLTTAGANVLDIGLCGTEEVYFATGHLNADGGIMVTASHNPIEYNGMKFVGPGARPVEPDSELPAIRAAAERDDAAAADVAGEVSRVDTRAAFSECVAAFAGDLSARRFRIVANAGNGTAGAAFDHVLAHLETQGAEIEAIRVHFDPDQDFPNGIPNPLLPGNRTATADAVRRHGADIGLAWDGDFDRCFFFDERGDFVDGEHVVALLARSTLSRRPGATILCDPRVIWATSDAIREGGGTRALSRTGHAFMKAAMRETGAAYGGEMSAHHYFSDFHHCDSGMIPWVLMLSLLASDDRPLSEHVNEMRMRFPSSGEINFRVDDPGATMSFVEHSLRDGTETIDRLDGLSLGFGDWRVNLRASNTEPLLRLNVETRGDRGLLGRKVAQVSDLIAAHVARPSTDVCPIARARAMAREQGS